MAMIHVNRAATSLGVFPEEEVREGLRTGRFAPTDIGWHEGMANWQSLSQFPELGTAAPPAPPVPANAVGSLSMAAQTEPLAIMSLILGGAGLPGSVLSGLAGVICGYSALSRIRKKADLHGRGLAISGLITGYLAVVLGLVSWVLLLRGDNFVGAIIRLSASTILVLGFFVFAISMAFKRRTWGWIVTANGFCLMLGIEGALGRRDAEAPVALILICMLVGFTVTAAVRAFRRRTRLWIMLALLPWLFIALGLCEAAILLLIHHPKPGHPGLTSSTMFWQPSKTDATKDPDVIKGAQALLRKDGSGAVEAFTNASRKFPETTTSFCGSAEVTECCETTTTRAKIMNAQWS